MCVLSGIVLCSCLPSFACRRRQRLCFRSWGCAFYLFFSSSHPLVCVCVCVCVVYDFAFMSVSDMCVRVGDVPACARQMAAERPDLAGRIPDR